MAIGLSNFYVLDYMSIGYLLVEEDLALRFQTRFISECPVDPYIDPRAQDFLNMFLSRPELASVYGPLTLEEANSNLAPVSAVEKAAFRELMDTPEWRERMQRVRQKLGIRGVQSDNF